MSNYNKGTILAIISAICFSVMPIFTVFAYNHGVTIFTLLFIRFVLAAILLLIYVFVKVKPIYINKNMILKFFILGGILYTLQAICYFNSVKYLSPSFAALILYLYPIFVCVISSLIEKEKLTSKVLFSILLSFSGLMASIGMSDMRINPKGVFFGVSCAIIYSVYIVISNKVVKEVPSIVTIAYVTFFASISFLIIGISTRQLNFHIDMTGITAILAITIFSTIISMFTFFKSLEYIGSTKASILSMIEPVSTIILSAVIFNERLTFLQILGGAGVLCGALLVILTNSKDNTKVIEEVNN